MKSILMDFKLVSLIPKFASEKIEPENMVELSDEVISRLGLTTIGDRHRLHVLCANAEKQHQSASVAVVEGADRGGKRKLSSRRTWTVSFVCLVSRHQSRIPSSTTATPHNNQTTKQRNHIAS